MKFGILVVGGHLEGTVSPIFYLGLSFYFMESRKFWCKKWQKVSLMYHPIKCPPCLSSPVLHDDGPAGPAAGAQRVLRVWEQYSRPRRRGRHRREDLQTHL